MNRSSDKPNMPNFIKSFRDLDVYKKAFTLSIDIHKTSINFPKHEQFALTSQMRRASKGICANIAEGFAKQQSSKAEFQRFLMIAMGSATEMQVWIDYALELKYIDRHIADIWQDGYDHTLKMLQKLHHL